MVLSTTALAALRADQRRTLEAATGLVSVAIPTIEAAGGGSAGGGSARSLLAEDFLPRR
ncbi:MAG: hypothetical protein IPK80_19415 [Nannocystis sp.]|nr:hypothetical protein [Nannocystis sp.]